MQIENNEFFVKLCLKHQTKLLSYNVGFPAFKNQFYILEFLSSSLCWGHSAKLNNPEDVSAVNHLSA